MSRPKVLLAEDHTVVAKSLVYLLRDDFEIVGTVGNGQALLDAVPRLRPDVIIADIQMPVMGGLEALRQLRKDGIDVRILILTAHHDAQLAAQAVAAGAHGFVLKQTAGDELLPAIQEVLHGRVYVSPLVCDEALEKN
jgi:DNA-binding NarL/FixJ family response regulator